MIVVVLRTKPSGLYRHQRRIGLRGVTEKEIYISELPSLPSTQRRVPYGHMTKSSILYLHSPRLRPKYIVRLSEDPLIQDSLSSPEPGFNDDESGAQIVFGIARRVLPPNTPLEDFEHKDCVRLCKTNSTYHRREYNIPRV